MNAQPQFTLASRGLRPVSELGANRPHGDRLRYMAGCRCFECRRANSAYESGRQKARAAGDWNGFVSAERARAHIIALSEANVGRRAVSDASDVAESSISAIRVGEKKRIRAATERRILAVTVDCAADQALISAASTWRLLNTLLADGYSKAELARRLGFKTPAIQIKKNLVTVRNAHKVKRLHEELKSVESSKTLALLRELREEGYSQKQIEQQLGKLAYALGRQTPSLKIGKCVPVKDAELIERLYIQLTD